MRGIFNTLDVFELQIVGFEFHSPVVDFSFHSVLSQELLQWEMITSDEDISIGEVEAELSDGHVDSIGFLHKGSPVQLASSKKSTDV